MLRARRCQSWPAGGRSARARSARQRQKLKSPTPNAFGGRGEPRPHLHKDLSGESEFFFPCRACGSAGFTRCPPRPDFWSGTLRKLLVATGLPGDLKSPSAGETGRKPIAWNRVKIALMRSKRTRVSLSVYTRRSKQHNNASLRFAGHATLRKRRNVRRLTVEFLRRILKKLVFSFVRLIVRSN